jgi:hypothetical protein
MTREPRLLTLREILAIVAAIIVIGGGLLLALPNPGAI